MLLNGAIRLAGPGLPAQPYGHQAWVLWSSKETDSKTGRNKSYAPVNHVLSRLDRGPLAFDMTRHVIKSFQGLRSHGLTLEILSGEQVN